MNYKNYTFQIGIRLGLIFLAMLGLAFAVVYKAQTILMILLAITILITATSLVRYMHKTIRDLESFLSGFRYGDFQQNFTIRHLGANFYRLETLLKLTVEKFKLMRSRQEQQAVYFQSLVQHLPLPFLILHADGRVEILNMATRRAFNVAEITNTDQLAQFGAAFQRDVLQIQPGQSLLSTATVQNTEENYILTATSIALKGQQQKLVALQNVQGALDATELVTWQNLLRVTSHEILNSLAPVTSCAQTAGSLVEEMLEKAPGDADLRSDLEDIQDAIKTMARRSEGLQRFVQSYRQLTRMPPPKTQKIALSKYFQRLESLLKRELAQKHISLNFKRGSEGLTLLADEDMLDQAMINLVRNAADALKDSGPDRASGGDIDVRAFIDGKQRMIIEVADNGPGVDPQLEKKIFGPFFTTKKQGSGVGLALVRYIMLTHGGTAQYSPGPGGGSIFRLIF